MNASSNRAFQALLAGAAVFVVAAITYALWQAPPEIDPQDPAQVAPGKEIYAQQCASCHGADLQGQENWRRPLPSGRMPAPPHDATGHTWHHPDAMLFGMVKEGLVSGKYAPPGYQSDMPAFGDVLSDEEIAAVLAYIMSTWPDEQRAWQRKVDQRSKEMR